MKVAAAVAAAEPEVLEVRSRAEESVLASDRECEGAAARGSGSGGG